MTSPFDIEAFDSYWAMWNDNHLANVRTHLDAAVTTDFVFCDPLHFHVGRDALEANVRALRADWPDGWFEIVSGVDSHHNRLRYRWDFVNDDAVIVEGLDIATVSDNGQIDRIDGFFGPLPAPETRIGAI